MKLNILTIQEQCLAISSSTRAMQDLYGDLAKIVATGRISLTYVVEVLNEHIREANRILEEELEPLIKNASVRNPTIEISIDANGGDKLV